MNPEVTTRPNIKLAVPFFSVANMEKSLLYYLSGLGFTLTEKWIPNDKIEWCYLQRDGCALMLQEFQRKGNSEGKKGEGVSICFICADALSLYYEFTSGGIKASEPFVGNGMWVVGLSDPDGYRLEFESFTDVPEGTTFSEWKRKNS